MPRLLFLVHGMGSNPPGWSHEVIDKLDAVTSGYAQFRGQARPFSSQVQIEDIRYDQIFDHYIQQWAKNLEELAEFSRKNNIGLTRTLNVLTEGTLPQDIKNVFWTTLVDTLFWRASPIVRDDVTATVMGELVRKLLPRLQALAPGETLDVSILSHSLGTSVMHDALALLGTEPYKGNAALTSAKFSFDNFFTVANVSTLGPAPLVHIDPYNSVVRPWESPPIVSGKDPYCARFYNFAHKFDPFAQWQRFDPPSWGSNFYAPDGINHVHDVNVHGFLHYLDHPRVHVPIINRMIDLDAIPDKEAQGAIANYPRIVPIACNSAYQSMLAAFDGLCKVQFSSPGNLDEIVANGIAFYQAAKQGLESCHGLVNTLPGIV